MRTKKNSEGPQIYKNNSKKNKNKRLVKLTTGIALSIAGLYWVFYDFDFSSFVKIMKNTNPYLIALSIFIGIITIIIRSFIWKNLLKSKKQVEVYSLFKAELIGYFGNNVLPFKFGELIRTYYVSKESNIPKSFVFTTVVFERLLDIGCLVILSGVIVLLYDLPVQIDLWIYKYFRIFLLGVFCVFVIILLIKNVFKINNLKKYNNYTLKLNKMLSNFRIQELLKPFFLSLLLWVFYLGYTYAIQKAIGLNMSVNQTLLLLVLSALVQIIPSAPGTVGTYHAAVKFTMVKIFGFETEIGVVMAILLHSISYILFTVLGAIYFVKAQIDVSDLYEKSSTL